jgi:hypothetical protein
MRRGASRRKQSSGEKSEKMRGRVAALTEHTWLAAPSPNGRAVVEAVSGQAKTNRRRCSFTFLGRAVSRAAPNQLSGLAPLPVPSVVPVGKRFCHLNAAFAANSSRIRLDPNPCWGSAAGGRGRFSISMPRAVATRSRRHVKQRGPPPASHPTAIDQSCTCRSPCSTRPARRREIRA